MSKCCFLYKAKKTPNLPQVKNYFTFTKEQALQLCYQVYIWLCGCVVVRHMLVGGVLSEVMFAPTVLEVY